MSKPMSLAESLRALQALRRDEVIVTAMGTAREWMALGAPHPLDFVLVPSSMGQATSLGLGLALAQPQRNVIVCNGDGSTLMNLGSLVTITAQAPRNLALLTFDNGVYEVTGSQATPGSAAARADGRDLDYGTVAEACGFSSVYRFEELAEWQAQARQVIEEPGPTFVLLKVAVEREKGGPRSPGPGRDRALRFRRIVIAAGG